MTGKHSVVKSTCNQLQDCSVTLIDKTDGSEPARREEYWRAVFKQWLLICLNRGRVSLLTPLHDFIYFLEIKV